MVKLNSAETYEPITIFLDEEKTPIAFQTKLEELMEEKVFDDEDEAKAYLRTTPFELELYYEKGTGLFAVESEAVEAGTIYSPYTAELCEDADVIC